MPLDWAMEGGGSKEMMEVNISFGSSIGSRLLLSLEVWSMFCILWSDLEDR